MPMLKKPMDPNFESMRHGFNGHNLAKVPKYKFDGARSIRNLVLNKTQLTISLFVN
jgi:hypothetical protein